MLRRAKQARPKAGPPLRKNRLHAIGSMPSCLQTLRAAKSSISGCRVMGTSFRVFGSDRWNIPALADQNTAVSVKCLISLFVS